MAEQGSEASGIAFDFRVMKNNDPPIYFYQKMVVRKERERELGRLGDNKTLEPRAAAAAAGGIESKSSP